MSIELGVRLPWGGENLSLDLSVDKFLPDETRRLEIDPRTLNFPICMKYIVDFWNPTTTRTCVYLHDFKFYSQEGNGRTVYKVYTISASGWLSAWKLTARRILQKYDEVRDSLGLLSVLMVADHYERCKNLYNWDRCIWRFCSPFPRPPSFDLTSQEIANIETVAKTLFPTIVVSDTTFFDGITATLV